MLIAEGCVASLVGLFAHMVDGHAQSWVAIGETIVVTRFGNNSQRTLLARKTVNIEELLKGLARHTGTVFQLAGVTVHNGSAGTVGTVNLHEYVFLVLASFTVEKEQAE